MTNETFESRINSHPQLVFFKEKAGDKYYVQNYREDRFEVPEADIEEEQWTHLEAVLVGRRQPKSMQQYTRVIGYYSNLRNWNASKLAELKDRHNGNYSLPEKAN